MDRQSPRTGRAAMFALLLLCPLGIGTGLCQSKAGGPAAKGTAPDLTNEPYVYQSVVTHVTFDKKGAMRAETVAAVKIQSQAGVKTFSILNFPYGSANSTLIVESVQVHKPDGSVVTTAPDSAQDMPSPITQQAPFYSDLREKQIAAKGLEPGDVLTYDFEVERKPLTPGEFWLNYDFVQQGIALRERLVLSVPKNRPVNVASGALNPVVTVKGGDRIYTWETSRLQHTGGDAMQRALHLLDSPPADVEVTSFRDWAGVGEWYRDLEAPEAMATATIQAKAAELTKGMTSKRQKLRAIYDFVSLRFRYVGVAFGIGRFRPHPAAVVLSNEYGDCKDKETLLAALLSALGIQAYPAMVNAEHKVVPSLPSPAQFDHLVAAVPTKSGYLWLDPTDEVAPMGYLTPNLRNREALVIPTSGPAELVRVPKNSPIANRETFTADGKIGAKGTLRTHMQASFSGDGELVMRLALRALPEQRWQELMQAISYRWGYAGTVSGVTVTPVDSTAPTLGISYDYVRKDYPSWDQGEIELPEPASFGLDDSEISKDAKKPPRLGPAGSTEFKVSITLPAGYTPKLPPAVNLVESFGQYHSTYSFVGGAIESDRSLVITEDRLPIAEIGAYKAFVKAVNADERQYIDLSSATANSATTEAEKLVVQAVKAWQQRDLATAATLFQKATVADGTYGPGWTGLGAVHAEQGNVDQGFSEMKKAVAVDPKEPYGYEILASKPGVRLQEPHLSFSLFIVFNNLGNLLLARS